MLEQLKIKVLEANLALVRHGLDTSAGAISGSGEPLATLTHIRVEPVDHAVYPGSRHVAFPSHRPSYERVTP